ncbi:hypothetical protein A2U01_0064352, partial [Trifolium medium]|nr:hypothetical protein [Trifolium medium]
MQLEDGMNETAITHQPVVDPSQGANHEEEMHTSSDDDDRIHLSSRTTQIPRRSTRAKFPSVRLNDHEITTDSAVNEHGDLVHLAFMGDFEPINWKEAVASS